jgi:hypothetical protein
MIEKIDARLDGQGEIKDINNVGVQEGDFNVVQRGGGESDDGKIAEVRKSLGDGQDAEDVLSGVGEPGLIPNVVVNLPKKEGRVGFLKRMGRLGLLVASLLGGEDAFAQNTNSNNAPSVPKVGVGAWPGQVNKRERPFAYEKQKSVFPSNSYPANYFPGEKFNASTSGYGIRGERHDRGPEVSEYFFMNDEKFIEFVFVKVIKITGDNPKNYNLDAIKKNALLVLKGEKPEFPGPKVPPKFWEEFNRLQKERDSYKKGINGARIIGQ